MELINSDTSSTGGDAPFDGRVAFRNVSGEDGTVGRVDVSAGTNTAGSRFNLHAKNLGLTYPQNLCTKERMLENVKAYFGTNLEWAVVCSELHEDGSPHLHCAVRTKSKVHIRNATTLDCISRDLSSNTKHGNYIAVKSLRKWLAYVIKDGNYVQYNIDVKTFINKKGSKYAEAVNKIIAGGTLNDIFLEDPGTWARHFSELSRIKDKTISMALMHTKTVMDIDLHHIEENISCEKLKVIISWMMRSLTVENLPRRSPQLYLRGPHKIGKSRLAQLLHMSMKTFVFPDDMKWEDWDDSTQLVISDEPGSCPLRFMNKFLSGEQMTLPGRFKKTYKRRNVAVMFLSNNSPSELYPEASLEHNHSHANFVAYLSRLEVVDFSEGETLHPLCDLLAELLQIRE